MEINYKVSLNITDQIKKEKETPYIVEIKEDNKSIVPIDLIFLDKNNFIRYIKKGTSEVNYIVGEINDLDNLVVFSSNDAVIVDTLEEASALEYKYKNGELVHDGENLVLLVKNNTNREANIKLRNLINGGMH